MLISVIIPVYNVASYLKSCMDSVLKQTYKELEIILVDDGSTDGSENICDDYAQIDGRIKVIHKENGGLSSARNEGIRVAQGNYITFIDSDDLVGEDMIEQLLFTLTTCDAEISVVNLSKEQDKISSGILKKYQEFTTTNAIKEILLERKFNTSACGKLFKKELFKDVKFPVGEIYEDYATTYRLFWCANKIAFADIQKYFYRTNPKSITNKSFSNKRFDYFIVSDRVLDFTEKYCPKLSKYVKNRRTRYAISFYKQMAEASFNDEERINYLVKLIRKNIFKYLFSNYRLKSKFYGLAIAIMPKRAYNIFAPKS